MYNCAFEWRKNKNIEQEKQLKKKKNCPQIQAPPKNNKQTGQKKKKKEETNQKKRNKNKTKTCKNYNNVH